MIRFGVWTAVGILIGLVVHLGSLLALPSVATQGAFQRLSALGPEAKFIILPAAAPGTALLPFPDPAVRMAACWYDLSKRPAGGLREDDGRLPVRLLLFRGRAEFLRAQRSCRLGRRDRAHGLHQPSARPTCAHGKDRTRPRRCASRRPRSVASSSCERSSRAPRRCRRSSALLGEAQCRHAAPHSGAGQS